MHDCVIDDRRLVHVSAKGVNIGGSRWGKRVKTWWKREGNGPFRSRFQWFRRRIFVNFSQSVAKLWNKWRTGSRMSKEDVKGGAESKGGGRGKGRGKGKGKDDQVGLFGWCLQAKTEAFGHKEMQNRGVNTARCR